MISSWDSWSPSKAKLKIFIPAMMSMKSRIVWNAISIITVFGSLELSIVRKDYFSDSLGSRVLYFVDSLSNDRETDPLLNWMVTGILSVLKKILSSRCISYFLSILLWALIWDLSACNYVMTLRYTASIVYCCWLAMVTLLSNSSFISWQRRSRLLLVYYSGIIL